MKRFLVERLARRYLAEGEQAGPRNVCSALGRSARRGGTRSVADAAWIKSLEGRVLTECRLWPRRLMRLWRQKPDMSALLRLAVRLGNRKPMLICLSESRTANISEADRVPLVDLLGQAGKSDCVPLLLDLLTAARSDGLRGAVLSALQPFPDPASPMRVGPLSPLVSRPSRVACRSCSQSCQPRDLRCCSRGRRPHRCRDDVPSIDSSGLPTYKDERIAKMIAKHWGTIAPATAGEKNRASAASITILGLGGAKANAANGRLLFQKHCAVCHTLFGEGNKIGPDLTSADRKNRSYLTAQIVDPMPSSGPSIRRSPSKRKDGRSLYGLVVENTPGSVTLVDSKNERTVVSRARSRT